MISIEELTKMQMILLTLLVSFVTSIATGIITASLLAEAPVSITQTINRVVERTIETVVPVSSSPSVKNGAQTSLSLTKEEMAILASFELASMAVVEIREISDATSTPPIIGVIVSSKGLVVAPREGVKSDGVYSAKLANKTTLPLTLTSEIGPDTEMVLFKFLPQNVE